jgi:hypothetical protein
MTKMPTVTRDCQSAEPSDRGNTTDGLHGSAQRSILVQRKMRARSVVVGGVVRKQPTKVPLTQYHDMVEALASDRSDEAFYLAVLPWSSRGDGPVSNAHRSQSSCDDSATGAITVTDQEGRCLLPRKRFGDLPGHPRGGRVRCYVGPDEPAPLQGENYQRIKTSGPMVGTTKRSTAAISSV